MVTFILIVEEAIIVVQYINMLFSKTLIASAVATQVSSRISCSVSRPYSIYTEVNELSIVLQKDYPIKLIKILTCTQLTRLHHQQHH